MVGGVSIVVIIAAAVATDAAADADADAALKDGDTSVWPSWEGWRKHVYARD